MNFWDSCRTLIACFFVALFAFPPQNMVAQNHVVSPGELQQHVIASSQVRQQNIQRINHFFSSPLAQKALKDHHIDATQVTTAVSQLSDDELAKVAARAEKAQKDFAAGAITDHLLILIVVAIAVVLVIILAVKL